MRCLSKTLLVPMLISLAALLLPCSISLRGQEAKETLRAGTARVDITPDQPVQLSGYANRTALSEGVHDRIFARAIAFERAGKRLVMVSTSFCRNRCSQNSI